MAVQDEYLEKVMTAYVEELAVYYTEYQVLVATAFRDGLISKKMLDDLTSPHPQVSVEESRKTLFKHVNKHLQERLKEFEVCISTLPAHDNESEIMLLAVQAVREGLLKKDVPDYLASLHALVPISMRLRYLLMCVHGTLREKMEKFETGGMLNYRIESNYHQLAELVDKRMLGYLIYPKVPRILQPLDKRQVVHQRLVSRMQDKLKNSKVQGRLLLQLDYYDLASKAGNFLLGPKQLCTLNELLVSYAYKWKDLGIALGFQPQDLKNIQDCPLLLNNSPNSYLSRLLEDWLMKKLESTLSPTVNNLKKALSSQTVGLGILANKVQAILSKTMLLTVDGTLNLPYGLIRVSSLAAINSSAFPKHMNDVYLKENESTLLELQIACDDAEYYQYKWFSSEVDVTGHSPIPILCLHEVDIDWDGGEFFCEVKISPRTALTTTVPFTIHVSCPLDQFKDDIASMYLAQPEVPEDTWPPVDSQKYINLALIKQQKINYGSEYSRLTIRGDVDDILHDKQTIEYKEVYKGIKSGQLLLIEGRPGSGKTTFVHKITRDWATTSGGAIRLLLLVSLRVLNAFTNPNLSDILKLFKDLRVDQEFIEKRAGKGVCFIFDGFDEFSPPDGKYSIVYKIINKTYLTLLHFT